MKVLLLTLIFPFIMSANLLNGVYKYTNLKENNEIIGYSFYFNGNNFYFKDGISDIKFTYPKHSIVYNFKDNKFKAKLFDKINFIYNNEKFEIDINNSLLKIPTKILDLENSNFKLNSNSVIQNDYLILTSDKNLINKETKLQSSLKAEYISYFGGSGFDFLRSITEDKLGNMIFGGETYSTNLPLPKINNFNKGGSTQVIMKTKRDLEIIWISFIGGSSKESIFDVCVDDENHIWGVGETTSGDYPITSNAFQKYISDYEGVVFSLNSLGELVYGSYYGYNYYEALTSVEYFNGLVYMAGQTGESSGFYAIINKNGDLYFKGRFVTIGANSLEDLAVDSLGNMFVTGTVSQNQQYNYQKNTNKSRDSYVARFNITTKSFDKMRYIGGSGIEKSYNIELDKDQYIYITGTTTSSDFPIKNSNTQKKLNQDYFLIKLDLDFETIWAHYIGGNGDDGRTGENSFQGGLAIKNNKVFIGSYTSSNDFPLANATFNNYSGDGDAFIQYYSTNGEMLYSTFFGGTGYDENVALYCNNYDELFCVGLTNSSDITTTSTAFQKNYGGGNYDSFILKLSTNVPEPDPCNGNMVEYQGFSDIKGLRLVSDAVRYDSTIRLTKSDMFQKGAVWLENPYSVSNGFTFDFTFETSEGKDNSEKDGFLEGADGYAFVIQGTGNDVIGYAGGGIGYEGLKNALAIEIDLYYNNESGFNDPNGNHLAVFGSKKSITADHNSTNLIAVDSTIEIIKIDKTRYYFKAIYQPKNKLFNIYLNEADKPEKLILTLENFDLSSYIDLGPNNSAYFGITSATGSAQERHEIKSLSFCGGEKVTGVEEEVTNELLIYPNPAKDYIYITKLQDINFEVIDLVGNTYKLNLIGNKLDISNLARGIYFIKLNNGQSVETYKFIKE